MDKDYHLNVGISKALSPLEAPLKIKHARSIIIATHRTRSVNNFWTIIIRQPLMENRFVAWKFCHILHKVLREGHENAINQSQTHKTFILEVGKLWGHLHDGVGKCIELYTKLLVNKLEFHQKNSCFSGSLTHNFNEVATMAGDDLNIYFQLCVEVFDYLDHILEVQYQIFLTINTYRMSSMTPQGQCRLAPLITLIQDANPLYDVCVRLMFRLHDGLQHDVLIGHRSRFIDIFSKLKLFYENVRSLQYFSDVIQHPFLPENAPNFSSEIDLGNYITPIMVLQQEQESLVDLANTMETLAYPISEENIVDEKDVIIRQLQDQLKEKQMELERFSDLANEVTNYKIKNESIEREIAMTKEILKNTSSIKDNLELQLREMSALEVEVKEGDEKVKQVEDKFKKIKTMYSKLREEHISLLRMRNEDSKQLDNERKINQGLKTEIECYKKKEDVFVNNTETNSNLKTKTIEYHNTIEKLSSDLTKSKMDIEKSNEEKIAIAKEHESQFKNHILECEQIKNKLEQELVTKQYQLNELIRTESEKDSAIEKLELKLKNITEDTHVMEIELKKKNNHLDVLIKKDIERQITVDSVITSVIKSIVNSLKSDLTLNDVNDGIVHEYAKRNIETIKMQLQNLREEYEICKNNNKCNETLASTSVELFSTIRTLNELIKYYFNNTTDMEKGQDLRNICEEIYKSFPRFYEMLLVKNNMSDTHEIYNNGIGLKLNELQNILSSLRNSFGENFNIADMLQHELKEMDKIIEEAAKRMMEMHLNSKLNNEGIKLEVNEKIIDSCTNLMRCIIILIKKSRNLQEEIVIHGKGMFSEKEFYKRNSQWTEGLISASKNVAKGANFLVDAADKSMILESNECFEIIVAAQEIAASTAQLVIASRVKASKDSRNLIDLINASRDVSLATGLVVATVKDGTNKLDYINEIDTTKLTTSQRKTMEMEMHIKVLQLEQALDNERQNLMAFRKKFYQSSDDD